MPPRKRTKRRARPWGTGSIWQREDGRWGWGITRNGTRYSGTEPTEAEAEAELDGMIQALEKNLPTEKLKQTVGEFLEEWLESVIIPHRPQNTIENYTYNVKKKIIPLIGDLKLRELRQEDVQAWVNRLCRMKSKEGGLLSGRTVRLSHSVLSGALQQAIEWKRISENPARNVILPKTKKFEIDPYSEEEVQAFLHAAKGDHYFLVYCIALTLCLRLNELVYLEWSDLKGNRLHVKGTKNETSDRKLLVPPHLLTLLHAAEEEARKGRQEAGERWQGGGRIVLREDGKPARDAVLQHHFNRLIEKERLRRIRFHDLRHSGATLRLLLGEPIHSVAKLLGHKDPAVTLRIYSHVLEAMEEQVSERINEILTPFTVTFTVTPPEEGDSQA